MSGTSNDGMKPAKQLMERPRRVYVTLRELGWFNTSLYGLNRLLGRVSKGRLRLYRYYLTAQPVAASALLPSGRGRKIEIRLIQEQDEIIAQFPRPPGVIQARFKQNAKCLVASKEQRFIGFLWFLPGNHHYQEDEVRARYIPLPAERTAWDFDVYVEPDFRIGLTFLRLWDEANRILRENGVQWSCSRISAFNAGSLASHGRLGTLFLGSAIFFCAGRWQVSFASISPYFHLSSCPSSFPEFRINTEELRRPVSTSQNKPTME